MSGDGTSKRDRAGHPSVGVVKALQENGLLSLTAGPRTLRFLPSFAAEEKDFEDAALILARTLEGF